VSKSVAIAGGGIIGMSAAWRLAQHGFRVTVFEKGSIGSEASWAGAGMLAPGGEVDSPSLLSRLAIESRELYTRFVRELEQRTHVAIDYQERGALDLAYNASEWHALRARAAAQAAFGVQSKELSKEHVAAFWPRVSTESLHGALFYAGDAIVNPRDVMLALAAACRQNGVMVRQNSAVLAVTILEAGIELDSVEGSESFDALVIAAGAWSSSITLRNVEPLPVARPIKGQLIGFQQPDQTCNTILRHGHTYLLQRANGLLIAGASVEYAGWDRTVEPSITNSLVQQAAFVLPHLAETSPSENWVGFRPGSDDVRIGPWHSKRLYLAYGHYRNGILLAPVTADHLAREISSNFQTP
jgi:glycine oxidase